jgi:hypothetical protein
VGEVHTAQAEGAGRRFRLASPVSAVVMGGLVLVLMAADVPLARLAHLSVNSSGGSVPVWFSAAFGAVGFAVAWRRPRNPLGWILLAEAAFGVLSEDASFYAVADYRLGHGGLPLGWVALLAQPSWAPGIVLTGLAVLLFPDGRLPPRRWQWAVWSCLALGVLWIAGAITVTVGAIAGQHTQVDASGNLLLFDGAAGSPAWWNVLSDVSTVALAVCLLGSLAGQVSRYRRSSGERRQQLKWLASGAAALLAGVVINRALSGAPGLPGIVGNAAGAAGLLALPVAMGVAIFRYRLFDIDRLISRTLAYAIVTGLLVGVYAGIVLLATRLVSITGPVAVAASTLAAAALFNPLRRRVQLIVDRRFNRARYDADRIVAAFAARLKDAVDLNATRAELLEAVHRSLEPTRACVWLRPYE